MSDCTKIQYILEPLCPTKRTFSAQQCSALSLLLAYESFRLVESLAILALQVVPVFRVLVGLPSVLMRKSTPYVPKQWGVKLILLQ